MSMLTLPRPGGAALRLAVYDGQLRVSIEGPCVTALARARVDESVIVDYGLGGSCVLRAGTAAVLVSADEALTILDALPCLTLDRQGEPADAGLAA